MIIDGAMENHVRLIFDRSWVGTLQAGALMAGGLGGLGQIAFPFDAKVMATGSKASKGGALGGVRNGKKVGSNLAKREFAANVRKVISKFAAAPCWWGRPSRPGD